MVGLAEVNNGHVDSAHRRVAEAAQLIDGLPDTEVRLHLGAIHWLGWCEHHLERYDDVLRHYERGLTLGARAGQRDLLIMMQSALRSPNVEGEPGERAAEGRPRMPSTPPSWSVPSPDPA